MPRHINLLQSYFKYLQLFVNSDYGIWPLSDAVSAYGLRITSIHMFKHDTLYLTAVLVCLSNLLHAT